MKVKNKYIQGRKGAGKKKIREKKRGDGAKGGKVKEKQLTGKENDGNRVREMGKLRH